MYFFFFDSVAPEPLGLVCVVFAMPTTPVPNVCVCVVCMYGLSFFFFLLLLVMTNIFNNSFNFFPLLYCPVHLARCTPRFSSSSLHFFQWM